MPIGDRRNLRVVLSPRQGPSYRANPWRAVATIATGADATHTILPIAVALLPNRLIIGVGSFAFAEPEIRVLLSLKRLQLLLLAYGCLYVAGSAPSAE
jgi:hypothetical protein